MPVTLATALQKGLSLANVEESVSWGSPALRVRGKLMACVPTHKSAEPNSLLLRIDRNDRAALLAEAPELYYAPEHYLNYDAVLVRLDECTPEILHDLLAMAYRFVCPPFSSPRQGRRSVPVKPAARKTAAHPPSRRKSRPQPRPKP